MRSERVLFAECACGHAQGGLMPSNVGAVVQFDEARADACKNVRTRDV